MLRRMDEPSKRVAPLDVVLMFGAVISVGVMLVFPLFVVPSFINMYQDFGSQLPAITQVVISGTFSLVSCGLALVCAAAGIGLVLAGQRVPGRVGLLAAVAVTLLVCAFVVMGLYLPIFQLAGAVRA